MQKIVHNDKINRCVRLTKSKLIETTSVATATSIGGMKEALKHEEIKQYITGHGTQFIKNETEYRKQTRYLPVL
jgi:hypothetical protein